MRVIAVEPLPGNDLLVRPSFLVAADLAVKHRLDAVKTSSSEVRHVG